MKGTAWDTVRTFFSRWCCHEWWPLPASSRSHMTDPFLFHESLVISRLSLLSLLKHSQLWKRLKSFLLYFYHLFFSCLTLRNCHLIPLPNSVSPSILCSSVQYSLTSIPTILLKLLSLRWTLTFLLLNAVAHFQASSQVTPRWDLSLLTM